MSVAVVPGRRWPRRTQSGPLAGLRVTLPGVRDEPRLALLEPELDLSRGAVAVLRQLQVHDLAVRVLIVGAALLLAPQEEDEVGVLLDRARFAQVRQPRFLRLPHLRLAAELAQ